MTSLISLCNMHPLFLHLALAIVHTRFNDFYWLCNYDIELQKQQQISPAKKAVMMACVLHFQLDTLLLMQYLGNNYTGACRVIHNTVQVLSCHNTPDSLICNYIWVMTMGCPAKFVSGSTRANVLLHW
jgi:hypothetical protein